MNLTVIKYFKQSVLALVLGFSLMMSVIFLLSSLITKIPHYEAYYPILAEILKCIPVFVSTRITAKKYRHALILIALAQTLITAVVFLIIALINYSGFDFTSFLMSVGYMLTASFAAVFLPFNRRKKQR